MVEIGVFRGSDREAVAAFVPAMFDDEQDPLQRPAADFAIDHADAMFRAVADAAAGRLYEAAGYLPREIILSKTI